MTHNGLVITNYNTMHYHDNENATTEFGYDYNGNMIYDKDRGISTIQYNVLNLPDRIQYSNGNQTMHEYDALGNRVRTTYYTRKSLTAVPIGNILHPENNVSDYTITIDGFNDNIVYTKVNPAIYNGTTWLPKFVHNPEGMVRHYSYEEHYPFYFIKDHLGSAMILVHTLAGKVYQRLTKAHWRSHPARMLRNDRQGQPHAGSVYAIGYYCRNDKQVQHFYATRKNCVHTQKMQIT